MLIRNFKTCTNEVRCHLFKTFCSNVYSHTLWCRFTNEIMRQLKVPYDRIFRILMSREHNLRQVVGSFRKCVFSNENILVRTVVDSVFFTFCRLSRRWREALCYIDGDHFC